MTNKHMKICHKESRTVDYRTLAQADTSEFFSSLDSLAIVQIQ